MDEENVVELLQRYRRDRQVLLNYILSGNLIKKVVMPPGAISLDDVDIDQVSVDYVLNCAKKGEPLDLGDAIRLFHDSLDYPYVNNTGTVEEFYLLTKPEYSGPAPTREPPPIPATAPSPVVIPPPDVEPAPVIVSSPVAATNLTKSQSFDSPTEKELTIDDIEDFEDDEDEFDSRRASRRHQTDASDLLLRLPLFETGITDDDLCETAYAILVAAAGASGGLIVPQKEKKKEKRHRLMRKLGRSKSESVDTSTQRQPGLVGLLETMRAQLEITESMDIRTRQGLLNAMVGKVGKRMDNLLIPLELLCCISRAEFSDMKAYLRWQKRQLNMLEEGLINHPVVGFGELGRKVNELRSLFRKIEESESLPPSAAEVQRTECLRSLREVATSLSERPARGDLTGEVCHWADGYHLNVALYEKMLGSVFDILDEGKLTEEAEEILELLKSTWRILGITETVHDTCYAWVLFRQFVLTGEQGLLKVVIDHLRKIPLKEQRGPQERLHLKSLRSSVDAEGSYQDFTFFQSFLSPIQKWVDKKLNDYHLHFSEGPSLMADVVTVAMLTRRILYEENDKALESPDRDQIDRYISSSVKSAFLKMAHSVEFKADATHEHVLASLAEETKKLLKKDTTIFTPVLTKWHPQAAVVSASLIHKLYGNKLRPFLEHAEHLTEDVVSVFPAADALEQYIMSVIASVTGDDGLDSICRNKLAPYQIESKSGTLVLRWVNGQLERIETWVKRAADQEELRNIRAACQGPWIVLGDFNLIYKDEDKNNGNLNRALMGRFRRLINDLGLQELPLHGRKYTWSNQQDTPTLVRLDRFLCTVDWEQLFPNCLLQSTATDGSDHCPLLLGLHDIKPGKARFHFEAYWTKLEGFQEAVEIAWTSVPASSCPFDTLSRKFRATVRGLQSWSEKRVGHINSQLGMAKEIIHQLEIAQDGRPLSNQEKWLYNHLRRHALALSSLQRTIARSRSRISWLSEGDANTALFHLHARHRKRKNFISSLISDDGLVVTKHEEKEKIVNEYYYNLLGVSNDRDSTINLEEVNIPSHDLAELDAPFSEEEVWKTIMSLPSHKAPGPDGFTGKFYKACWQIIKVDIMTAVSAVWSRKLRNFEQLNSAFITLLPKKEDATSIKDFRPISLVHSFAKLITKLLANRLAGRLDQMVSPNQSAFIKGRFIQDNFMLVQQTARFLHQQKQARLLLKLDITKAFDSVSWPFLLEIMKHLGFGPVWCDIISGLLASASTQVLLNGSPGETILHRRGLRQGDPLSPMLFILVMDVLCYLVKKASDEGLLQPLARRALQHRISLYADDVVIFLCPSANDIGITLDILQLFGDASGLRTNVQKSNGFPIRCSGEDIITTHEHLPCQLSDFPCKYLGVPLSLRKLTKQQVQPIIDRIADCLPGWKADLLTKAGRKTLVQYVLTSMLVYLAMAMDLPPGALKAIDKIRRGFLWRGRRDAKGGHCLLAWPKVTRPPELGGLGISQLQQLGWALRMRWLWLQKTEPDRPWAAFQIQVHPAVKAFFKVAIVSEVGNGKNTIFWTDRWLHGQSLDQLVPNLFRLVNNKARKRTVYEALTEMKWVQDIRGVSTTVTVLTEFFKLWDLLSDFSLQPEVDDTHLWQFSSSGVYSAKSAYEGFFIGAVQFGPWERIWKSWAPGKCKFFMWLVAHNRCWTADRLAKRGLPHPECCPLCDQAEETIDHLLISCVFSRQVWYKILHKVGLQNFSPQPDNNSFDAWWASTISGVDDQTKKGLNSIIILGAWSIWNHRNRCVFDGTQPSLSNVLVSVKDELFLWSLAGARGLSNLLALESGNA